jgi:threonine synthase
MAVEPATAVAFAGLEKLIHNGTIQSDEKVVVNCTGHTFPVEKHVLGEQWAVESI